MSRGFNRACFMHADMARMRGQYRLMRAKRRSDHGHIRLGASHKKMHIGFGRVTERPHPFAGARAVIVGTVAVGLFSVCTRERLKHPRMRALAVIIFEAVPHCKKTLPHRILKGYILL